jgi:cyanophycinase
MKTLMAMGGALNRKNPVVLREFVRRAGGPDARIAILPQASALEDTGRYCEEFFRELGAAEATAIEFRQRSEADSAERLAILQKTSGIFIAGGNQMRLTALISGTKLETELHQAYQRGVIVGGTSAGSAILSKIMIAYGKSGPTPREGIAQFLAGFGFTDKVVFDQHFRQRDRLGRLAYAVAASPGLLGVGVDEDTAAILVDDDEITVTGSGAVTILDGNQINETDVAEIGKKAPIAVSGLILHLLTTGCTYRLTTRQASIPVKVLLSE